MLDDIVRELKKSENERHREMAGAVADAGDESVANLFADLDAAEIDRDVREVPEIEAALGRMTQGNYGLCLDCGIEIPAQRLLAEPAAARCILCAERFEQRRAHAHISRL
jgi:RNA polymerase-binding protein DksA